MMIRVPGVPLLPGTLFRDVSKNRFPRTQHWMHMNGVPMLTEKKGCAFGGEPHYDPDFPPIRKPSLYPTSEEPKIPDWLAYDKQVLCFFGYFQEDLHGIYNDPYIVRKVKIYFYLEDRTIKITEPPILNSGIAQGCLVSRQRIPRFIGCKNDFLSILDFNVTKTVRIFDRFYHITGCDLFTRQFLTDAGIHVPEALETPSLNPGTGLRKHRTNANTKRPKTSVDTFGQFLKFDRQILRFFGYWEDKSAFGDIRELEIHYYLADDTIEIKELLPLNSGRVGTTTFLKRQKLPKDWNGPSLPGVIAPVTILNVLGKKGKSGRYIPDPLGINEEKQKYYMDKNLSIGEHLNVFGRDILLCDCDGFTQQYYRKIYGIESFTPIPIPRNGINHKELSLRPGERDLPPYNGWGSHEDSEGNCITIDPKPPHIDFKKFVALDRLTLRFGSKMKSRIKENNERIFVISYYLADDTISVFELAARNSGFTGGEFLKRDKFLLPKQILFSSKRPEMYKPFHFYLGATITLSDHVFHIMSADEYTLAYMEQHPFEFPLSGIRTILTKIREALRPEYKNLIKKYLPCVYIRSENGRDIMTVSANLLREALIDILGSHITEHEILTVCRYFSVEDNETPQSRRETVRAAAHGDIRRSLWNDLTRLREHIYHLNPQKNECLPSMKIRSIIIGCRLPFSKEMIDKVLNVLNKNPNGDIEVEDFVNFIDVKNNPAPAIPPMNVAFELCPKIPFTKTGKDVNWSFLLEKIGLESEIK